MAIYDNQATRAVCAPQTQTPFDTVRLLAQEVVKLTDRIHAMADRLAGPIPNATSDRPSRGPGVILELATSADGARWHVEEAHSALSRIDEVTA